MIGGKLLSHVALSLDNMIDPKRLEFLRECCDLSNDEWGETIRGLLYAYDNCVYTSDEFKTALEKELETELIWAECSCTIVERTETREVTYRELEINE